MGFSVAMPPPVILTCYHHSHIITLIPAFSPVIPAKAGIQASNNRPLPSAGFSLHGLGLKGLVFGFRFWGWFGVWFGVWFGAWSLALGFCPGAIYRARFFQFPSGQECLSTLEYIVILIQ